MGGADQAESWAFDVDRAPFGALALDASGAVVRVNAVAAVGCGLLPASLPRPLAEAFTPGERVARAIDEARELGAARAPDLECAGAGPDGWSRADLWVVDPDGASPVAFALPADERLAQREELDRLRDALGESERARRRLDDVSRELARPEGGVRIVGASRAVAEMLERVDRVAPTDATVLIHGESGSGKELVARALHERSPRAGRAWVAINCAAMPETLLESELFGHERGAFTGAERRRLGKFELADQGTLFLDEVAELSPAAQAKLLRVLQDGEFARVGGVETVSVDVRVVAATHRDLAAQVRRGRFREDLFFRLNVFRIDVPPLRDRREDIRPLAEFFHERHARRLARPVRPISDRALRRLLAYRWPGNVRELENTVERATLLGSGRELEIEMPDTPGSLSDAPAGAPGPGGSPAPRDALLDLTLDQLQRLQIMHALETRGYRVFGDGGAAGKLGIHPRTLLSRMDKLGIPRPRAMRAAFREDGAGDAPG